MEFVPTEFRSTLACVSIENGEIPTIHAGFVEIVEESMRVFHRSSAFPVYVFGDADLECAVGERGGGPRGIGAMAGSPSAVVIVCIGRGR